MEALATFAACVYAPGDIVEVRRLPSKKSTWCKSERLAACAADLKDAESRGENLYAGANPRKKMGDRDADGVALARCLFVDFDNQSVEKARLTVEESGLPAPTLILSTGGGAHFYWRLDDPILDLGLWSRHQQALIARLGCDGKIKDPPRIMRLPGFRNHKRERVAEIVAADPDAVYPIVEFGPPVPLADPAPPVHVPASAHAASIPARFDAGNVGRLTRDFLAFGAPVGERNQRAYMAACELQGNGCGEAAAMEMVRRGASACGLDLEEADAAVRSAFKKPHTASRAPMTEARFAKESGGVTTGPAPEYLKSHAPHPQSTENPAPKGAAPADPSAAPADEIERRVRMGVSNVLVDRKFIKDPESGKTKPMEFLYYRRIDDVSASLLAATGGWPKCAAGLLFAVRESPPGFLPTASNVRYFSQPVDLWAWVSEASDPYWTKQKVHDMDGHPRTPATKEEFHRHLRDCASQRFMSVSLLPHCPPIPGTYYVPCELPTSTGRRLAEFLAMLNPDTEADRQLILACLLTPLWGGPPGGRPIFIFDSRHGRGSGKTATAQAIGDIYGGLFRVSPREEWDVVKKRLMSDRALSQRVALIDNVKAKLGGPEIEDTITGATIDGWRPYHGNFSRPNDMTWLITQNAARGGCDIAKRAVTIHIGAPRHGDSFLVAVAAFIEAHRAELIADAIALLSGPAKGVVSPGNRDRFQAWQDGPLARCDDPDGLARLVIERREELDSDSEEAEAVAAAIGDYVAKRNPPTNGDGRVKITRDQLYEALKAGNVIDETLGKRGVYGWVLNMLGTSGPLAQLSDGRASTDGARVWLWEVKHDIPV